MAENKTKPTGASVRKHIDAIEDEVRRKDCRTLVALMRRVTGHPPKMWGPSIIGFGKYHYRYASGHEGDSCLAAFSSRKGDLSIYVLCGFEGQDALLSRLGKHRAGKCCLYVKRLEDIDLEVLEEMTARSVALVRKRHPES